MKTIFNLFIFIFVLNTSSLDANTSTPTLEPTCKEMTDRWYDLYSKDFKTNIRVPKRETGFSCDTDLGTFVEALYYLENMKFTPNDDGYAPNFYLYVKSRIGKGKILFIESTTSGAVANNGPGGFLNMGNRTRLTHLFMNEENPINRASTLIHESRHVEKNDPKHVDCPDSKEGSRDCDEILNIEPATRGAYGTELEFNRWVAYKSLNVSKKNKDAAHKEVEYLAKNRFLKIE